MKGRRGISPLIATILLIAFAVALGSLVYSYIVIFQGGTGSRGCSNIVSIDSTLKTADGVSAYQVTGGQIVVDVRNTGYTPVSSVDLTYVGSNDNIDSGPIKGQISMGKTKKFRQAYDQSKLGTLQTIVVTPYFVQSEQEVVCPEASITIRTPYH